MRQILPTRFGPLIATISLLGGGSGFSQGCFYFNNTGGNGAARAPVYGPEPTDPSIRKWGNTAEARPPGAQAYSGPLLAGSGYSVAAWYSLSPSADVFDLMANAVQVDGTLTNFPSSPGYFFVPRALCLDGLDSNGWYVVYLQVRAWDNANGQLASWQDAWDAAQDGSGRALGWSKVFLQQLVLGPGPSPGLVNFESFNLFVVPEPRVAATLAFGGVILGWWVCASRQRQPRR